MTNKRQSKSTRRHDLHEDYPGQYISGPDYDTRDREAAAANAAPVRFTAPERALLGRVAYGIWTDVGHDVLQAVAEQSEMPIERVTVSRAEAIEIALDAGRFEAALRRLAVRKQLPDLVTLDLLARVDRASYRQLIAAVRGAFSYARYGL
jgi:hypothetical protein